MKGTDNKGAKTKKDAFSERLKQKYPEQNFDQEEDFFSRVNDDYDDYEQRIAGYEENEKALTDLFARDARSAAFLTDWQNGGDPLLMGIEKYGMDFAEAANDPEKKEAIAEANAKYLEKMAKQKELDDLCEKNLTETLALFDRLEEEGKYTEDEINAAWGLLKQMGDDAIVLKVSEASLKLALNAINHDTDVATAAEDAEVKGRNARIDERLRKKNKGDGTASLDGKNGNAGGGSRRSLGALDRYDGQKSIFERGGEKRITRH